jgi:hypothetical protein
MNILYPQIIAVAFYNQILLSMYYNILHSQINFMNELPINHSSLTLYIPTDIENNILCA